MLSHDEGFVACEFAVHNALSKQALYSQNIRKGLKDTLLGPARFAKR